MKERERGAVDPNIIRAREEVESLEKDKPCLTMPLACVALGERMPHREWMRSDRRESRVWRGGRIKVRFLDTDKINGMRRERE